MLYRNELQLEEWVCQHICQVSGRLQSEQLIVPRALNEYAGSSVPAPRLLTLLLGAQS